MRNVKIVTTYRYNTSEIRNNYGLVTATAVAGEGLSLSLKAETDGLDRYGQSEFSDSLDNLYTVAAEKLKEKAAALGANVVAGVRFNQDSIVVDGRPIIMVAAQGTAIYQYTEDSFKELCQELENKGKL